MTDIAGRPAASAALTSGGPTHEAFRLSRALSERARRSRRCSCSALAARGGHPAPVVELNTSNLGLVLATPTKLGFYYWDTEKKAGGKIKCTGACAKAWPPVLVTGMVEKHYKGVMGTFGTIKRPDGTTQLTERGLAVYTFHGDTAGVVKCDGVDGWHAVRA